MDECVQLHGSAGYMDEYEISRVLVNARISGAYAGTSEIMREIIARSTGLDLRKRARDTGQPATQAPRVATIDCLAPCVEPQRQRGPLRLGSFAPMRK